jgi:hypothetical protein
MLTEPQLNKIFSSMLAEALDLSVQRARRVIGKAGIDLSSLSPEDYDRRPPLEAAARTSFSQMTEHDKYRVDRIMIQELADPKLELTEKIHKRLEDLGFMFNEGEIVAINLLDTPEA